METNATKNTKAMAKAIQNHKNGLRKSVLEEVTNALNVAGYDVQSSTGYQGASGCGLIIADELGYSCQVKIIMPKRLEKAYTLAEETTEE
jgi:hypothetical protein